VSVWPAAARRRSSSRHVGSDPRLRRAAGALPGHRPVGEARRLGHQAGGLLDLLGVGVAGLADPLGERMRAEEDMDPPGVGVERRGHPRRLERDETGVVVPVVHGDERNGTERGGGALEVLLRTQGGAVRGEHDADDTRRRRRGQLGRARLDRRFGVLGPERDRVAARGPALEGRRTPSTWPRVRSVRGEVPPMAS